MAALLRWTLIAVLGRGLVGCSAAATNEESSPGGDARPPGETAGTAHESHEGSRLCDGSDGVRFVYTLNGGINGFSRPPHNRFESRFLAIDGRCNYWFGGNGSLAGIRGGTFPAASAARLSEALNFGRFATAAAYQNPLNCLDGSPELLSDGTAILQTSGCGTDDPAAPAVWSRAFSGLHDLLVQVEQESEPRWGPSRLLAIREPQAIPGRMAAKWTSEFDLDAHAVLPSVEFRQDPDSFSVLVEDAPTLALLEELRRNALAMNDSAVELFVEDSLGRYYRLSLRDVVLDKIIGAIDALTPADSERSRPQ